MLDNFIEVDMANFIGTIAGHDGGEPYGGYTYTETDEKDEEEDDGLL